jgi:cell division protease FtsH
MNLKKIFRGPILWIVLAVVIVWIGSSLITMSGYKEITTEHGLQLLSDGKATEATIVDNDQRVDLTLSKADGNHGTSVQF